MDSINALGQKGDSAVTGAVPPSTAGLLHEFSSLWHEVQGLAHDQLTLAALETKLAGRSLVIMIAAGVMIAILLISAWLGIIGAAVLVLIEIGFTASMAMLLAVTANLVAAFVLYGVIRKQSYHLQFPATLRSLRPVPSALDIPRFRDDDQRTKST